MSAKKCIICQQDVVTSKSAKVKDDFVIRAIRKIKSTLRISQGNELYVCEKDLITHREKRKKFERSVVIWSTIALLLAVIIVGLPLLTGRLTVEIFASAIAIGVLMVALVTLFEYTPAVEDQVAEENGQKPKAPYKKKKR